MNKKIIFVTGDKGGVGKTTTAKIIADYFDLKKNEVEHFDTDKTNATFKRFIGEKCHLLDVDKEGSLDELIDELVKKPEGTQFLIDCAARSLDSILSWMDQVGFEGILSDYHIDVTFAFVLGSDKDSLQILMDLVEDMENFNIKAQYFIIKNLGRAKEYSLYENSKLRQKLLQMNSVEITLDSLLERTFMSLDKNNIRFLYAESSEKLSVTDKQRSKSFLRKAFESLKETSL